MGKKGCKTVSRKQVVSGNKVPKTVVNPDSFYDQTPVWSFSFFDSKHDRWGLPLDVESIRKLLDKLAEWGKLKWRDLLTDTSGRNGNTKNHPIPVERIIKPAQIRLQERNLDDYEILYSLSINNKFRIWGVMLGHVYYLIWIDLLHEICPSSKRHT